MSFDPQVLRAATQRLELQKNQRKTKAQAMRHEAYLKDPSLQQIDKELRSTMAYLLKATLTQKQLLNKKPTAHGKTEKTPAEIRDINLNLQATRLEKLKKLNIDPESLSDSPLCEDCSDSGWNGSKMCHCLHKLCTEEQLTSLSNLLSVGNQSFAQFTLDYYSDIVWPDQGCSPQETMKEIHQDCLQYAQQFGHYPLHNLLFIGQPGLGKTFLAACIARKVAEQGFSVVYETAIQLFHNMNLKQFRTGSEEENADANSSSKRYYYCDLLIIDDLGSELTNNATKTALYELLNTRLLAGKHHVITSNFPLEELTPRYSAPIMSRIEGEFELLDFFGYDVRKKKKEAGYP